MDIVKENHAINAFMDDMNKTLHDVCIPLYRKKSEYPIDRNVIYWNCVFLASLYVRINNLELSKTLIDSLFPEKGSYEAITWYYGTLGEDPVGRYMDSISRLIAKSAYDKGGKGAYMFPDLTCLKLHFFEKNEEIRKFYFYK